MAELGESEVDQRREAQRNVYQLDALAAEQVGDGALGARRRDDVAVAARQRPQGERVVGEGGEGAVMDEEDLDVARPKAGDDLSRIGQQPVAGAAALVTQPGNPKRLGHRAPISSRRSSKNGRFCSSGGGTCRPGSATTRPL